jgi:hypothetical protein
MNTDVIAKQDGTSGRALLLLGLLAVVALGGALLVSLFVPAEWSDPFTMLRPPPPIAPVSATPVPGEGGESPLTGDRRGFRLEGRGIFGSFAGGRIDAGSFVGRVAALLLLLGTGTLTLYLVPRRVGRIAQALEAGGVALARLFLVGLAGYIVFAAVSVLAAITLFGAPVGLLLLIMAYAVVPLGLAAISLPLGRATGRRFGLTQPGPLVDLLAGLLIIFILSLIPLLGTVLLVLLAIVGFGAVVLTRAGSAQGWDLDLSEVRY